MKSARMSSVIAAVLALGTMTVGIGTASAAEPADANCFGQSAAIMGQAGIMGEHSSSFPTPRLGIGNLARLLGGEVPGDIPALVGLPCEQ
jgi:hypothetical protein